jgi:hypothetical protein
MVRALVAICIGVAAIGFTSYAADDAKKDATKTIEGKLVCTKCTLKETKACGHAVKVKEGDKEVIYYLKDGTTKEMYHKAICPADSESDVKVTGKLVEKDGKKTIEDPKVEVKK